MMAVVAILIGLTTGVIFRPDWPRRRCFHRPCVGIRGSSKVAKDVPCASCCDILNKQRADADIDMALTVILQKTEQTNRPVSQWACSQGDDGRRRFQISCCAVYSRLRSSWSPRACGLSVE
jgi:hypothetical protein